MDWNKIVDHWRSTLAAVERVGGDVSELTIERPCTTKELAAVETAVGYSIPSSFRDVLLQFSKRVEFHWFLPESLVDDLPIEVDETVSGEMRWSLDSLVDLNRHKDDLVQTFAPDPNDSYSAMWHKKFCFNTSTCGDLYTIDISDPSRQSVVYLSKEDNHGHGFILASDFKDFLARLSILGCPGGDDRNWLAFTLDPDSMIDSNCVNAKIWRKVIGLQV